MAMAGTAGQPSHPSGHKTGMGGWVGHGWYPCAHRIGELTFACVGGFEGARVEQPSHPSRNKICMGGWVGGLAIAGGHARTASVN